MEDMANRRDRSDFNGSPLYPAEDQAFLQAFSNNHHAVGSQLFDSLSLSG
jgi:hypothetical protein